MLVKTNKSIILMIVINIMDFIYSGGIHGKNGRNWDSEFRRDTRK